MNDLNPIYNNQYDVVYDEKDTRKKRNFKPLIILVIISLALIVFFSVMLYRILKPENTYKITINAPEIVYMDESINVTVSIEGKNKNNLNKIVTSYYPSNEYIFYALEEKVQGNKVSNVIVPIQEGTTDLLVTSSIEDEDIGRSTHSITVCPSFDKSLLPSTGISVVRKESYSLNIDFGEEICSKDVMYAVTDNDIATVDQSGVIMGNKVGNTTLVIRKGERIIEVPLHITDKYIKPQMIQTNINKIQLMSDETYRLKVNTLLATATTSDYTFSSSDEEVATISPSGLIKAGGPGTAIINVSQKRSGLSKKVIVVVDDMTEDPKDAITIIPQYKEIRIKKGMSKKLLVEVRPDTAQNSTSTWKSDDQAIAFVNSNGVVYARNIGTTNIVVTNGTITSHIKVTVEN